MPCNSLLLTAEDDLETTVRVRLDAMGADTDRVFACDESFALDADGLAHLDWLIQESSAELVVIDPIVAYLPPGLDLHRANEVRTIMSSLAELADRHDCAIVIIRHLSKGTGGKAIYRGLGSIDFTAACRSVLLAGHDPDNQRAHALVHIKSNLGPLATPIGYSIEQGQFTWTGETELTAGQLLAPETDSSSLGEAKQLLREILANGPVPHREVKDAAEAAGVAMATVQRAKKALDVKSKKEGMNGAWMWSLPCS